MSTEFTPLSSLPSLFDGAVESIPLWPPFLAEDYSEYSRRYAERANDLSWRGTRIEQRDMVDKLIHNILEADSVEQREALFRKAQNETVLFYYERLQLVRHGLVEQISDYPAEMGIRTPDSWNSFWQALLLKVGKVCEPE